ncbi:ABC transporter permease [Tepidibacter formicigenes]|uniref:ABC-2 type transport system permease protein n=1 Tax=Tepidibacter formicigenes DSM 15518 TaxID=1123349 RepID=A0A1M6MNR6_9FIRM|nr:ABC transporter permease [Tepidibacter formicigenes]SHJ85155.1 ABC-2 type transport system permease protein [Tepidibacter formicigenes DSM 15518]
MEKIKKYIMPFILIFVIPIIVNTMLCYMFSDNQIKEIPTAVYLGDNTQFSRSIVKYFDDSDTFDVKYYTDSPYEIEKLIIENKARFGLLIPNDFYKDLKKYKSPTILTVYDGSQLSITSFAKIQAGETLLTLKGGALIKVLQGKLNIPYDKAKKIVSSIGIQTRLLFNPTRNYTNYLMPGFMTAIVQVGLVIAAAVAVNREKRRNMITYLTSKIFVYSVLGFISLIANIYIQVKIFNVPFRGDLKELLVLTFAFTTCVSSIGMCVSTVVWDKVKAAQVAAVLFLPNTIMIGYTYPLIGMLNGYQIFGKYIPLYHYADNLRDIMIKGYIVDFLGDVKYLLIVCLIFIVLAVGIEIIRESKSFKKKDKREGEIVENI